jgi:hypothetical protein
MRIMVAPQKVGVGLATNFASIKLHRPLAVGLTEMDLGRRSFIPQMRDALGSSYTVVSDDVGVHSQEIPVAILTGPLSSVLSSEVVPISPDIGTKGIGNDRYLAVVRFAYRDHTYVVMHSHTNAVIQNLRTKEMLDNPRVKATAKAMKTIEDRAQEELADPDVTALWIMGDFNYLPVDDPALEWPHSPPAMFRRLGMTWTNTRVIYLAWSSGVHRRGAVEVVAPHTPENASDHGWLSGHFRRSRTRM